MPLAFRHGSAGRGKRTDSGAYTIKEEPKKGQLVLIEPDASVRDALTLLLRGQGWAVKTVESHREFMAALDEGGLTAVVSESSLPICTPQEILDQCSQYSLPVVFTGHDLSLQGAVDLIRQGAIDYLDKPFP